MQNFLLYKTSPLLGGQMKYDLVLDSDFEKLYISEFQITPISKNIIYVKNTDLSYNHQTNIKKFYDDTYKKFYDNSIDPVLDEYVPLALDDEKSYSDDFLLGCSRSDKYDKQFEFFIPLWLEKCQGLRFNINIKNDLGKVLFKNQIELSQENNINSYHNMISKYFINYLKYIKIFDGDDRCLNIKLNNIKQSSTDIYVSPEDSWLHGIDVSKGLIVDKSINGAANRLLDFEKPVLEFNNNITDVLKDNKVILKQLFNFNLCFNLKDIISNEIEYLLKDNSIIISVDCEVFDGDKWDVLEERDIFTNYEYIAKDAQKYIIDLPLSLEGELVYKKDKQYDGNVLDYMYDYKCPELILKNKLVQSIPYWQIDDSYIFNAYDGFSGDNNNHNYGNIRDYSVKEPADIESICYINTIDSVSEKVLNDICNGQYNHLFTHIKHGYINGLYYPTQKTKTPIKVLFVVSKHSIASDELRIIKRGNVTFCYNEEYDELIVISRHVNELSYRNFMNSIKSLKFNLVIADELIKNLYMYLSSVQEVKMIYFNNSLTHVNAEGPTSSVKEIDLHHIKASNYMMRYDGNIKPHFFKPTDSKFNYFYEKCLISDKSNSETKHSSDYLHTGYPPAYPSIGYYIYNKYILDYKNCILNKDGKLDEYKWFNNNKYIV